MKPVPCSGYVQVQRGGHVVRVVEFEELVDGHIYVRTPVVSVNGRVYEKIESGPYGEGAIVRRLGYRVVEHGPTPIVHGPYVLVRCQHGVEGAKVIHRRSRDTGCFRGACDRVTPRCRWCGRSTATQVMRKRSACQACDRQLYRQGGYPCGKPRRTRASKRRVIEEHLCGACEPWPGKETPPPKPIEPVVSRLAGHLDRDDLAAWVADQSYASASRRLGVHEAGLRAALKDGQGSLGKRLRNRLAARLLEEGLQALAMGGAW